MEQPPRSGPSQYLPFPEAASFTLSRGAEQYDRRNLARLVNGGSERYVEFGFQSAAAGEYRHTDHSNLSLRMEIFDMGTALGAFGYLAHTVSELRDPATAESPGVTSIREAGLIGPGALSFARGQHYVRLILQDLSPEATLESLDEATREHLPPLARYLARSIPGGAALPAELAVLPRRGRVRRSEQYHVTHTLDMDGIGPGVSALYGDPGPRFYVGVPLSLTEERARQLYQSQGGLLQDPQPVEELGHEAQRGQLPGRGKALVARQGAVFVIVLAADQERTPRQSTIRARVTELFENPQGSVDGGSH